MSERDVDPIRKKRGGGGARIFLPHERREKEGGKEEADTPGLSRLQKEERRERKGKGASRHGT